MNEPEPIENGGPAFPHHVYKFENSMSKHGIFDGMSLRDYFAGVALSSNIGWGEEGYQFANAARDCYRMADAMIEARKTQTP
jgi:hypothetical protein